MRNFDDSYFKYNLDNATYQVYEICKKHYIKNLLKNKEMADFQLKVISSIRESIKIDREYKEGLSGNTRYTPKSTETRKLSWGARGSSTQQV